MTRRGFALIAAGAAMTLSAISGCGSSSSAAPGGPGFTVKGADTIPTAVKVTGEKVPDGLRKYVGKPMVVNFFSSTCEACKEELPALEKAHEHLGDKVTFVGVATVDLREKWQAFAKQYGVTYEIVDDPDGVMLQSIGGQSLPATAFVTPDGIVHAVSLRKLDTSRIEQMIREQLGV